MSSPVAPPAHPITLDRVFFTRTVVIAIPEYSPENGALASKPKNNIDIAALDDGPGRYLTTMRTIINPSGDPSGPYSIDMECAGVFVADDTLSPEDVSRGMLITAHSVLYGAIREAVAWITGRHPHGQVMLGLSVLQTAPPDQKTD